jgi:hypothetical protein
LEYRDFGNFERRLFEWNFERWFFEWNGERRCFDRGLDQRRGAGGLYLFHPGRLPKSSGAH